MQIKLQTAARAAAMALLLLSMRTNTAFADSDDAPATASSTAAPTFGPFGLLDHRSKFYQDWFPEPLRVEDTTLSNEVRFDWQHNEGHGSVGNELTFEIQKSVGLVNLELQVPYVDNTGISHGEGDDAADGSNARGFADVEFGARVPVWQYVSATGFVDNSLGVNIGVGIPTRSGFSRSTTLSPGIFDDLAIGERFSVQSLFSFSSLIGPMPRSIGVPTLTGSKPSAGRESFEYGLSFGYAIEDEDFAIPRVERLVPIIELVGDTAINGSTAGHNSLTGTLGFRAELKPFGKVQPQVGIGYVFPIDQGGRNELRWGIFTSVVFEF